MEKTALIQQIRLILNEKQAAALTLISEDTTMIDETINVCLPAAIQLCMERAPLLFAVTTSPLSNTLQAGTDITHSIMALPADFNSLVEIKLDTWERPVTRLDSITSSNYKIESNKHICSKIYSPHCYISHRSSTKVVLLYPKGTAVQLFSYLPRVDGSDSAIQKISDKLTGAIAYMCAALVLQVYENIQGYQSLERTSINLLNIESNK